MNDQVRLIAALIEEFNRWEEFLAGLSEEQITSPLPSSNLSIKDVIAHLRAWQQVSIARLEAALFNNEPEFPAWLAGNPPELEENLNQYNEWIYQANREQPWSGIYQVWKEGFLRFLELAATIPENDLLEVGRYAWLKEYPLSAVLLGSYEHHHEHLELLLTMFPKV
jgi:hypothetical protein